MYDIIIIGAGPAGLTSAIYAARAGKKVLVFEALSYGGQIVNTKQIDNYPALPHISGFDFSTNLYNQARELGAEIRFEKAIDIKVDGEKRVVVTENDEYETKAIIIAIGVKNRKLELDREQELIGKGISYCATCDGNFYKDKIVAVNGGGNTALDDALYLSDICKKVYLIHRRDEFRAASSTVEKVKSQNNIELVLNSTVTKLIGDEKLESIEVTDKDNNVRTLDVNGLFVAIGQIPENNNVVKEIELNDKGYIVSGEDCHTNIPRVYVAGDIREKDLRQLTTACSDGSMAATVAVREIKDL